MKNLNQINFNINDFNKETIEDNKKQPDKYKYLINKLHTPRLFELGRTKIFNITEAIDYKNNSILIHPESSKLNFKIEPKYKIISAAILVFLLIIFPSLLNFINSLECTIFILVVFVSVFSIATKTSAVIKQIPNEYFILINLGIGVIYIFSLMIISEASCYQKSTILKNITLLSNFALIVTFLWKLQISVNKYFNNEPIAFFEGVSIWPTEIIRCLALVVASYFVIELNKKTNFEKVFKNIFNFLTDIHSDKSASVNDVRNWINIPFSFKIANRYILPIIFMVIFYCWSAFLFIGFGIPTTPARNIDLQYFDIFLNRALLMPIFMYLLFLVLFDISKAVSVINKCIESTTNTWSFPIKNHYRYTFNTNSSSKIDDGDLKPWIDLQFVVGISNYIYKIIGYPVIVALLIVIARSNYFDNWIMPLAFKILMVFSLGILMYWDHRLNDAADDARQNALMKLREKTIKFSNERDSFKKIKIEQLIWQIENLNEDVYKSFSKRPIFQNSILIVIALLADSLDYSLLANSLF